jgi:D-alanyl-D-alanine carboxypeptidase/D-alanyl-D-alanine-endopeptidase (penicillin-binding protein 4)
MKLLGVACLVLLTADRSLAQSDHPNGAWTDKIQAFINGPSYKQARWGVFLADAASGETVYAHNPDQLFLPASTTKLFSCAAALAALGPDFRFETPVYRRGEFTDGRLQGDLILVAKGDPTLGGRTDATGKMAFRNQDHIYASFAPGAELLDVDPLNGLKDLAKQVALKGVREVTGEVLIDDRYFPRSRGSGSGPDILTPIVINDNLVDLKICPAGAAGEPAVIEMRPQTKLIQIDASVTTVGEHEPSRVQVTPAGPQRHVVRGKISIKSKPAVAIVAIDDPSLFARALFIDCLRAEGVQVSASALRPPQRELPHHSTYPFLDRVAVHTSPPFSEVIKVTLKVSHNLYASMLPILVAARARDGDGTLATGLRMQGKFLAELGLPVETISFGGGAGGSNADAVTPRATVQLLQAMAKRPEAEKFFDGLPVLGVDGTLAESVPSTSPARGKVRAKTGTLVWQDLMNDRPLLTSKALAGTLTSSKGREFYIAVFVNNVPLPRGVTSTREGKALGTLCELIVEHAP